uniref:HDC03230 n=1 Tax=Drosophila melanogaster TaxID=7227 RepID=Q6IH56_DROME|nr:TPA_inf: HDC03230 [Drosophila melanogaster]
MRVGSADADADADRWDRGGGELLAWFENNILLKASRLLTTLIPCNKKVDNEIHLFNGFGPTR